MALSDASRYSGRPEVAVRALVAERQRFPDTPFAHAAAFLLGKLADDRGEVAAGLAWYRRYLVRDAGRAVRGRGAGAEDARGRADLRTRRRAQRRLRIRRSGSRTEPTCCRRTRSSRTRPRDGGAPHARRQMRSVRTGRDAGRSSCGRCWSSCPSRARRPMQRASVAVPAVTKVTVVDPPADDRVLVEAGLRIRSELDAAESEQPRASPARAASGRRAATRPRRPPRSRCRARTASPPSA